MSTTSTLIDLAVAGRSLFSNSHVSVAETVGLTCFVPPGENKVSVSAALSFIKLLFQYKQLEAFSRLTKEMLQVLPVSACRPHPLSHVHSLSDWLGFPASGSARSGVPQGRVRAGFAGPPQQCAVFSEEPRQGGERG